MRRSQAREKRRVKLKVKLDTCVMMPRDNMTSTVQKIARQALTTFRNPSVVGEHNKVFLENQSKLKSLLAEVRAADLNSQVLLSVD